MTDSTDGDLPIDAQLVEHIGFGFAQLDPPDGMFVGTTKIDSAAAANRDQKTSVQYLTPIDQVWGHAGRMLTAAARSALYERGIDSGVIAPEGAIEHIAGCLSGVMSAVAQAVGRDLREMCDGQPMLDEAGEEAIVELASTIIGTAIYQAIQTVAGGQPDGR